MIASWVGGLVERAARRSAEGSLLLTAEDDFESRDPDYIRDVLPLAWMIASFWFRGEVRGLEKIPAAGPVLLVGNHSGGNMTPDTGVFVLGFSAYFGVERGPFYQLAHSLVMATPGMQWLRKFGTVVASHENADRALARGAAVLVYPGGDYEVHRPSWESGRVDFDRRHGFIRLAHRDAVPLIPVVSIGGRETALFVSRGGRLARLLGLDRLFRLEVLPISLAVPWGLNVGDLLGHIPLPAKITVHVLDPIDVRARFGAKPDWDAAYGDIVGVMQTALSALQAERRLPLLG